MYVLDVLLVHVTENVFIDMRIILFDFRLYTIALL